MERNWGESIRQEVRQLVVEILASPETVEHVELVMLVLPIVVHVEHLDQMLLVLFHPLQSFVELGLFRGAEPAPLPGRRQVRDERNVQVVERMGVLEHRLVGKRKRGLHRRRIAADRFCEDLQIGQFVLEIDLGIHVDDPRQRREQVSALVAKVLLFISDVANQAFRKSDLVRDQRRYRNSKLAVASPLDER